MSDELQQVNLHGNSWAFRRTGSGPPLLLVHGIGAAHTTWDRVIDRLSERHTVIAPDLLGHGFSAKPRVGYSSTLYVNGLRDLLDIFGIEQPAIIGHSFGGGVAMQFAYQYPERVAQLVLVASGGLGREVSPMLRAISMPGADLVLTASQLPPVRSSVVGVSSAVRSSRAFNDVEDSIGDLVRVYLSLGDRAGRWAFRRLLRGVIRPSGQIVSALDRAYLSERIPTLIIWGNQDRIVPVSHGVAGHQAMPGSTLEIFGEAGHTPHRQEPERFVEVVERFIEQRPAVQFDLARWRQTLRDRSAEGS